MKKLIKCIDSADFKLSNKQFGSTYGSFIDIITSLVTSDGYNEVDVNKIVKASNKKEIQIFFTTPANYNHYIGEVVNLKDNRNQEYVIVAVDQNNTYITCEYYDNYTISTNESYVGKVVNSSIGFNLESNVGGKLIISDEYKVAKYIFHDLVSASFLDSDANKIVGMYSQAYYDASITAPLIKTSEDYNNNVDFAITGSSTAKRRCILNLVYARNQRYIIIGNGNFFYFITGSDSYVTKYTTYCFGTYTSYVPNDHFNSLIVSKAIYVYSANPINASSLIDSANTPYIFAVAYNELNLYQSTTISNVSITNDSVSSSSSRKISDILTHMQCLFGVNSPSGFTLSPSTFFGSYGAGFSKLSYPNIQNKMFLSTVNIISGDNVATSPDAVNATMRGKMPFMYWYGHPLSSASGNLAKVTMNDNGINRKFFVVNSGIGNSITRWNLAHIEITPNAYDNYYLE